MSTQLSGFSLQVTIQIRPEDVNKFLGEFTTVFQLVTAEPQCVFFEVYQSPESPGTISWVENWYALLQDQCFELNTKFTKERVASMVFRGQFQISFRI